MKLLTYFLEQYPDKFKIETKVYDFESALERMSKIKYDLSIIDYTLSKKKNWFDIVEAISESNLGILVLHTTNANKNIDLKRLQKIKNYVFLAKTINTEEIAGFLKELDKRVLSDENDESVKFHRYRVYHGNKHIFLKDEDIVWIEAAHGCIEYYTKLQETPFTMSSSLVEVEEALNPDFFIRVHRSFIINANYFRKVGKGNNSDGVLYLEYPYSVAGLREIPYSSAGREALIALGFPF
jgi:two-component system LytT family response regulator